MRRESSPISEGLLLNAITTVLSSYITETNPYVLFNGLLDTLLEITESEYGFIGEVFYSHENKPYLKSYATTNIAWSEETRRLYEENRQKGMVFSRLDSLYGAVLKTGQLVISNQPPTDPRSCGIPKGHPPLNAFMGIPFYGGGKLLGIVGIANRESGYHKTLAESLHPFLITCGNLIQAYRNNQRHEQVEEELTKYKERLSFKDKIIDLGAGLKYSQSPPGLTKGGNSLLLTRKESRLLEILVLNPDVPVKFQRIEDHIWPNVVVGESSLRSLMRRLRNKVPELSIRTVSGIGYMLTLPR